MKKWIKFLIIFSILLFAFFLRFFPIRMAHWWDETVYLQHAEIMFSGRDNFSELSFRPPLLSILFFFAFFIKHSVITASVINAFLGVGAAVVAFLIGRKIYSNKSGIIAGIIVAFLPFMIRHSNYLLTDIPTITFLGLSFYLSLFRRNNKLIFLSGIVFGMAVLMKFTAILMGLVFLLYFLLYKFDLKKILIFGGGFALILLPYLIWCYVQFGNPILPFVKGQTMVADYNEPMFFYFFNLFNVYSNLTLFGLIIWFVDFGLKLKRKEFKVLKYDFIFIFWILLFLIYLTKVPHKELRYMFPVTLPLILLAAKGFDLTLQNLRKNYKIWFWILFICYIGLLIYPRMIYISNVGFIDRTISDEMLVADYLKDIGYHGIIYTNQRWPVFAYYTGLETKLLFPYDERFYSHVDSLMKEPGILIGMFNIKEPQPRWLDENPHFVHIKDIGEFFIYEYKL